MPVRIVTDSTCDLPAEVIERLGIGLVPLYINAGGRGYLDGVEITRNEFYRNLPDYPVQPTTAVPSQQKFQEQYEAYALSGASEVISIHISSALSSVVNVALAAAREVTAVPVRVFDSRQLSLGTGFLVERAARMAADGCRFDEIMQALNEQVRRIHVFAALDTLEFLKRSGRMNRFVANLGALLQLKPILTMYDGTPTTERVRTRERATRRLFELLQQVGPLERLAILHTNAPARVAELMAQIEGFLPAAQIMVADITPVIGAHIGPGAFGFAAIGAQV